MQSESGTTSTEQLVNDPDIVKESDNPENVSTTEFNEEGDGEVYNQQFNYKTSENQEELENRIGTATPKQNRELKSINVSITEFNKESDDEVYNQQPNNKVSENQDVENRVRAATPKQCRELRSILELSKEANLDTNIIHKRKSIEPTGRCLDKECNIKTFTTMDSDESDDEDKVAKEKQIHSNKLGKRKKDELSDSSIDGAIEEQKKRSKKLTSNYILMKNNKKKDPFCWICHHEGVVIFCETCPRSFHQKCIKQNASQLAHWICPECATILKAENIKKRSPAMRDMTLEHLCGLLKFALKRMSQIENCEPFIHPVNESEFPEYKNHVVQPMTLTCLEKNLKSNIYGSTQAFEADAKWLLHNSVIFNSSHSKLTSIAKCMVKICKQEMSEIENCPTCYLNANTKKDTWFVEVCPKPHLLVWAKLKGFPYWPAKAMRTNTVGMVDVRFFGAHDRAWVPSKECFVFSLKDPNSNKQKRNDINESLKELKCHIENLTKVYGMFNYASYRLPLEPDDELKQLQLLLPKYNPNAPSKVMNVNKSPSDQNNLNGISNHTSLGTSEIETKSSETSLDKKNVQKNPVSDDDKMECEEDKLSIISDEASKDNKTITSSTSASIFLDNSGVASKTKETIHVKRPSSSTEDEPPPKLSRRNSNSSVHSNVSDKASKPDSLECFRNDDSLESIISDTLSNKNKVAYEANEPTQTKSTIADLLMKKLSERIEQLKMPKKTISNNSAQIEIASADRSVALEKENVTETLPKSEISESDINKVPSEVETSNFLLTSLNEIKNSTLPTTQECTNDDVDISNKTEAADENAIENSSDKNNITTEINDVVGENSDPINKSANIPNNNENISFEFTITDTETDTQDMQSAGSSEYEIDQINAENESKEICQPKQQFIKIVDVNDITGKSSERAIKKNKQVEHTKSIFNNYSDIEPNEDDDLERSPNKDVTQISDTDLLHSIVVKSEPSSEEEFETEYEQKRKYLSALNISERLPDKHKLNEITHISKENPKTFEIVDNITKIIDDVAKDHNTQLKLKETNMMSILKKKEIFIKPLSNMQIPKQKARKSFPLPGIKTTYPAQVHKNDILKISKSLTTPITSSSVQKSNLVALVTKAPDSLTNNIMFLTQPSSTSGGLTLIPSNQSISYSANISNPILTMVHHPISNVFIQQTNLPISTTTSVNPILSRIEKPSESQNFIPLSGEIKTKTTGQTTVPTKTTSVTVAPITSNTTSTIPQLIPVNFDNVSPVATGQQNELLEKLQTLTAYSPGNLVKAVNDIMSRPPPKLIPKPPGPLSTSAEEEVAGTAGPFIGQINSVAHRLTDYFREMFIEFLKEMGERSCPEAKIASLKLQLEMENHKHAEEMMEMKKNMDTLLKDLEKGWENERKRLIEEVRSTCQTENQKNLEEAKSKQWCANCSKEAQFYCCWNTSYCDYPCQQKHWSKHMSNCTQNVQGFQQPPASTANSTTKPSNQPIVLRQAAPPKGFTAKTLIAKPTKVYVTKSNNKNTISFAKSTTGNHITLVQSTTPGNYEVVGNGVPLPAGKFITNLTKVKSGNLMTVSSSSSASTSLLTGNGQKAVRISQVKQTNTTNTPSIDLLCDEICN